MSIEIETEVVVGTAKSCECVARNDVVVENDLEFGIEWNVDSGSNSSENLKASILPPVDESADNCDESTDSSSVFDDELVGSDVNSDIDEESESDRSVFESGHVGGDAGCKVFKKANNVDASNRCNFRKVESESSLFNSSLFFLKLICGKILVKTCVSLNFLGIQNRVKCFLILAIKAVYLKICLNQLVHLKTIS